MDELWRLSLTCLLWLRAFEIRLLKVDEHAGPFHSSDANKIILEQVKFVYIEPHSEGTPSAVSTKPLLPPECTTIDHVYSGFYSGTALYIQLPRKFSFRIHQQLSIYFAFIFHPSDQATRTQFL